MQQNKYFYACIVSFLFSYGNFALSNEQGTNNEGMSVRTYFDEESCKNKLNPRWNGAERYFWRKLCKDDDIDFTQRTMRHKYFKPDSTKWPNTRKITGRFIEEIFTTVEYQPYVNNRTLFISNIWLDGYIYLRNIKLDSSLIFIESRIDSSIDISRSSINQLRFNSSILENRLKISNSSLNEGLHFSNTMLKNGVEVNQSNISTLKIQKSTFYNEAKTPIRTYNRTGIISRSILPEKPSISIRESTIGFWRVEMSSMQDVNISKSKFNDIEIVGISKITKSDDGVDTKMSIDLVDVSGNFSILNIEAFNKLNFQILSVKNKFLIGNSKLSRAEINSIQSNSFDVINNEIESLYIVGAKIIKEFSYLWNLEDIAKQGRPKKINTEEIHNTPANEQAKNQVLTISSSEFGSLSLTDSRLREIILIGLDIADKVTFFLGQQKYEKVHLAVVYFGSLTGPDSEYLDDHLEFLEIAPFAMSNYIQFSESYRIAGLYSEADEIMITGYNKKQENFNLTRKIFYFFWHILTGYGYRLDFAFWWFLGAITLGSMVAAFFTRKLSKRNRLFFWYSLDMFLPFVQLIERHNNVKFTSSIAKYYFLCHKMFGYLIISYLIAGFVSMK